MNRTKSELMWWQLNEGEDPQTVRANVAHTFETTVGDKTTSQVVGQDISIDESELIAHAAQQGKDTWDNDDVAAFAGAQLGIDVTRKPAPVKEESAATKAAPTATK